jgi:Fe-S-cluster-containing hydrogenase component 2
MLDALSLDEEEGRPIVDPEKCIGCGVCTVGCPEEALRLHRYERTPPFQTAMDLYVTMAKDNDRA